MRELDHFLAQSLNYTIKKNLGKETIRKIEKRLFEKYGISFTESIEQFQKLDVVLREYFGAGADGIEKEFFENTCNIKSDSVNNKKRVKNTKIKSDEWITIKDPQLTEFILNAFGDPDKKKIFESVMDESKIVYDILKKSNIPQTSGYRKINSLIKNGLLSIDGFIETDDGKKVNKYKSIFQNIQINIIKNEITVDVQLSNQSIVDSSILLAMSEL